MTTTPTPIAKHPTNPPDLEGYLMAKARVQAIAHLKFKTKVFTLLRLPIVQEFLLQQGLTGNPHIVREQLEEPHWLALVEFLQRKPVQKIIREAISCPSKAG